MLGGVGSSCASPPPAPPEVPELSGSAPIIAKIPVGSIERKEVDLTVEAGLGSFLQRVTVEPVIEADKFVGFRLVDIDPGMIRKDIDVQVGDVVTRANGHALEVETEAFEAFEGLRAARSIELSVLRNGKPVQVVIPIVGEPTSAPKTATADAGAG